MSGRNLILFLRTAGNTAIPCLQAIVAKGYQVSSFYQDFGDEEKTQEWSAEKQGRLFIAERLEELLGLIAMWEVRGDDWRPKEGEYEQFEQLREAAPTTTPRPQWERRTSAWVTSPTPPAKATVSPYYPRAFLAELPRIDHIHDS